MSRPPFRPGPPGFRPPPHDPRFRPPPSHFRPYGRPPHPGDFGPYGPPPHPGAFGPPPHRPPGGPPFRPQNSPLRPPPPGYSGPPPLGRPVQSNTPPAPHLGPQAGIFSSRPGHLPLGPSLYHTRHPAPLVFPDLPPPPVLPEVIPELTTPKEAGDDPDTKDEEESEDEDDPVGATYFRDLPAARRPAVKCLSGDTYLTQLPGGEMAATSQLTQLEQDFQRLLELPETRRAAEPLCSRNKKVKPFPLSTRSKMKELLTKWYNDSSSSESDDDADRAPKQENESAESRMGKMSQLEEMVTWRRDHPENLYPDIMFNIPDHGNFATACGCSKQMQAILPHHNKFYGEETPPSCVKSQSNTRKLFCYEILQRAPPEATRTRILHEGSVFTFEGFYLFTHVAIKHPEKIPMYKLTRFSVAQFAQMRECAMPTNFTIGELDKLADYLMLNLFELHNLEWMQPADGPKSCRQIHVCPRFVSPTADGGADLLPIHAVLLHFMQSFQPVDNAEFREVLGAPQEVFEQYKARFEGYLVTKPGYRPAAVRLDHINRYPSAEPNIIHMSLRPAQLRYTKDPEYAKLNAQLAKLKYLHHNSKAEVESAKHKEAIEEMEAKLEQVKSKINPLYSQRMIVRGSWHPEGFYHTGIGTDLVEHALAVPYLVSRLRYFLSMEKFQVEQLHYEFNDLALLNQAFTQQSYANRDPMGTVEDHLRNAFVSCGIRVKLRTPEEAEKEKREAAKKRGQARRRGVKHLNRVMSILDGRADTSLSFQYVRQNNERLEFLGDAIIQLSALRHIFGLLPNATEGTLSIFQSGLVSNANFARVARRYHYQEMLLIHHNSSVSLMKHIAHFLANTFEAVIAAVYVDSDSFEKAEEVLAHLLWSSSPDILAAWKLPPQELLQLEEPAGDRHWIHTSQHLLSMLPLEHRLGVKFKHIRLLGQALSNVKMAVLLAHGNNERLEYLGDAVFEFLATAYVYKRFPNHHEGGLSLLRTTLLRADTQAMICIELGLEEFVMAKEHFTNHHSAKFRVKVYADLLEAFMAALYLDQGMETALAFCEVMLFPRLYESILKKDWNDPKPDSPDWTSS